MNVATKIITKLGGHQAVAEMLGCHITRVYRWTYPIDRGGTGGFIPPKQQRRLLEMQRGTLSPADFFAEPEPKARKRKRAA